MSAATRNLVAWVIQGLLLVAFVGSGVNKFLHLPTFMSQFGGIGLPTWFVYIIAGAEVLGGVGLMVRGLVRPAALGLLIIMAGAVFMHATRLPGGLAKGVPAMVLLALLLVVLFLRRPGLAAA